MQHFDFELAVGSMREIHIRSNYVYYSAGSAGGAGNTIALRKRTGSDSILLQPGQAFQMPESEMSDGWVLTNFDGEATIIGRLFIGAGAFTDNRISGSVEVIDGGKSRTLANGAFIGYAGQSAAAGMYPHVQILNPAGSGKNVVIEQMLLSSATASASFVVRDLHTALTTLAANATSKKIGGAPGVCQLYRQDSAAALGTTTMLSGSMPLNLKLTEPIVLMPGKGIVVVGTPVASVLTANFEWYEESVTS